MKSKSNPFLRSLVLATLSLTLNHAAHAAALTWTGGDGDWENGQQGGWDSVWSNTNPDTGTFNGPGGMVSVNSAITTGDAALAFDAGDYSLSAGSPFTVTLGNSSITVATGVETTIDSNVTLTRANAVNLSGGGTLKVATGGILTQSATNASEVSGGTTLQIDGGSVNLLTSLVIGKLNGASALNGTLIVNSGSLTIGTNNLNVGRANGDVASATLNGGSINVVAGNLNLGAAATSTSSFDLNGGILSVRQVTDANTTSTFNFNGGTLKASSGALTAFMTGLDTVQIRNDGAIIDTNGQSITIGQALLHSAIGGDNATDGGLTKIGQGALALSGANAYNGGTTVNQGVLAYLNKAAVSATGTVSTAAGAGVSLGIKTGDSAYYETTDVDTLLTSGTLGNITVNASGLAGIDTTAGDVSYTFTGSSTRGLAKSGTGTLTLTGSNTYSGPTALYGGTLAISSAANLGDDSATNSIIFGSGTLLSAAGSYNLGTNRAVSLVSAGTIQVDADTVTIDGAVSGAGSLTKTGDGTLLLSGNNTNTGAVTVSAGTLKSGSASSFATTGALSVATTGTFDLGGFDATVASIANVAGTITDSGAGSGTDTLTVTAQNVDGTSVLITDNGTRKIKVSLTSSGGGAYDTTTNVNNTYSGGLVLGNLMRAKVPAGTVGTPGAIVSGGLGRGPITINGGTTNATGAQIWFASPNRTLVNDVIVNGNAGNGSRSGSFRISYLGSAISGNITANTVDAYLGADGAVGMTLDLTGQLTGDYGFRFYNSGGSNAWTATLNNATVNPNDYAGDTTINNTATTVKLGAANQIPNGTGKGNVAVNYGTLDLAGFDETVNGLSSGGTTTGVIDNATAGNATNTLTIGDGDATGLTFSGVIKNTNGTLSLVKTGTGIQTLNGTNTYTGTTTIDGGRLVIRQDQSATGDVIVNDGGELVLSYAKHLATGVNVSIASGGAFYLDGSSQTVGKLEGEGIIDFTWNGAGTDTLTVGANDATSTFDGVIQQSTARTYALTKTGTGTFTLGGANTYSGNTTIDDGTLDLSSTGQLRFVPTTNGTNNAVIGTGAFNADGTFLLDLGGADATAGNEWLLVDVDNLTESFGSNFMVTSSLGDLTETSAGVWEITDTGKTWTFDESTGILSVADSSGSPYETWGSTYGLTAGSEGGDLDNDGMTNFEEFAFGLIPDDGSSVNPITVQLNKTTGQFTYQRLAASGLTYSVWTSPDLVNWTEDTGAAESATTVGDNESVEVTLSASVPLTASKLFVRVKAQ